MKTHKQSIHIFPEILELIHREHAITTATHSRTSSSDDRSSTDSLTNGYYDLGHFHRPVSTNNQLAQIWFDRGLIWSYAFNHEEAVTCFENAIAEDPSCAMAYWGLAYSLGPNYNKPWDFFDKQDLDTTVNRTHRAVEQAKETMATSLPLEQALINALHFRYPQEHATEDYSIWNTEYADAMGSVYREFPDDLDVAALYADALMNLTPWQLWDLPSGKPAIGTRTVEVKAVLDRALAQEAGVTHPGLLHLYIHLMEMSGTPECALTVADHLRGLVPDAGHLQHMPSHLDILCGDYRRAVASNSDAIRADRKFLAKSGPLNFYTLYRAHNYHFRVYAALFSGQSKVALDTCSMLEASVPEELLRVESPPMADWLEGFLSMRMHALVRFGRWQDILDLDLPQDQELYCVTTAMTHYAKGIAFASLGRVEDAEKQQDQFFSAVERVVPTRTLFNNTCVDILAVASAMLDGELAYRRGNIDAAFDRFRHSITLYDGLPYDEPWGWMQPVRHAYGALLLEQSRIEQAAAVYSADLGFDDTLPRALQHPNNVWALHGYHECLTKLGRENEARILGQQLRLALAVADVPIESSCFCRLSAQKDAAKPLPSENSQLSTQNEREIVDVLANYQFGTPNVVPPDDCGCQVSTRDEPEIIDSLASLSVITPGGTLSGDCQPQRSGRKRAGTMAPPQNPLLGIRYEAEAIPPLENCQLNIEDGAPSDRDVSQLDAQDDADSLAPSDSNSHRGGPQDDTETMAPSDEAVILDDIQVSPSDAAPCEDSYSQLDAQDDMDSLAPSDSESCRGDAQREAEILTPSENCQISSSTHCNAEAVPFSVNHPVRVESDSPPVVVSDDPQASMRQDAHAMIPSESSRLITHERGPVVPSEDTQHETRDDMEVTASSVDFRPGTQDDVADHAFVSESTGSDRKDDTGLEASLDNNPLDVQQDPAATVVSGDHQHEAHHTNTRGAEVVGLSNDAQHITHTDHCPHNPKNKAPSDDYRRDVDKSGTLSEVEDRPQNVETSSMSDSHRSTHSISEPLPDCHPYSVQEAGGAMPSGNMQSSPEGDRHNTHDAQSVVGLDNSQYGSNPAAITARPSDDRPSTHGEEIGATSDEDHSSIYDSDSSDSSYDSRDSEDDMEIANRPTNYPCIIRVDTDILVAGEHDYKDTPDHAEAVALPESNESQPDTHHDPETANPLGDSQHDTRDAEIMVSSSDPTQHSAHNDADVVATSELDESFLVTPGDVAVAAPLGDNTQKINDSKITTLSGETIQYGVDENAGIGVTSQLEDHLPEVQDDAKIAASSSSTTQYGPHEGTDIVATSELDNYPSNAQDDAEIAAPSSEPTQQGPRGASDAEAISELDDGLSEVHDDAKMPTLSSETTQHDLQEGTDAIESDDRPIEVHDDAKIATLSSETTQHGLHASTEAVATSEVGDRLCAAQHDEVILIPSAEMTQHNTHENVVAVVSPELINHLTDTRDDVQVESSGRTAHNIHEDAKDVATPESDKCLPDIDNDVDLTASKVETAHLETAQPSILGDTETMTTSMPHDRQPDAYHGDVTIPSLETARPDTYKDTREDIEAPTTSQPHDLPPDTHDVDVTVPLHETAQSGAPEDTEAMVSSESRDLVPDTNDVGVTATLLETAQPDTHKDIHEDTEDSATSQALDLLSETHDDVEVAAMLLETAQPDGHEDAHKDAHKDIATPQPHDRLPNTDNVEVTPPLDETAQPHTHEDHHEDTEDIAISQPHDDPSDTHGDVNAAAPSFESAQLHTRENVDAVPNPKSHDRVHDVNYDTDVEVPSDDVLHDTDFADIEAHLGHGEDDTHDKADVTASADRCQCSLQYDRDSHDSADILAQPDSPAISPDDAEASSSLTPHVQHHSIHDDGDTHDKEDIVNPSNDRPMSPPADTQFAASQKSGDYQRGLLEEGDVVVSLDDREHNTHGNKDNHQDANTVDSSGSCPKNVHDHAERAVSLESGHHQHNAPSEAHVVMLSEDHHGGIHNDGNTHDDGDPHNDRVTHDDRDIHDGGICDDMGDTDDTVVITPLDHAASTRGQAKDAASPETDNPQKSAHLDNDKSSPETLPKSTYNNGDAHTGEETAAVPCSDNALYSAQDDADEERPSTNCPQSAHDNGDGHKDGAVTAASSSDISQHESQDDTSLGKSQCSAHHNRDTYKEVEAGAASSTDGVEHTAQKDAHEMEQPKDGHNGSHEGEGGYSDTKDAAPLDSSHYMAHYAEIVARPEDYHDNSSDDEDSHEKPEVAAPSDNSRNVTGTADRCQHSSHNDSHVVVPLGICRHSLHSDGDGSQDHEEGFDPSDHYRRSTQEDLETVASSIYDSEAEAEAEEASAHTEKA